ncbi:453_t:CDS:2 [Funneliformis geosporum]|nr:453_t:CDS:2 [Funneliformis geosporum]
MNNDEEEGNNEIDVIDVRNKEQNYTLLSLIDESSFILTVIDLLVTHHLFDSIVNDIIGLFNNFYIDPTVTLPSNVKAA